MRVIKYRGFNPKNREWIFGFYFQNRGFHFVCPDEWAVQKSWDDYQIDPSSLGQFTGMKDCQKREIYEGDTVKAAPFKGSKMHFTGKVVFDRFTASFVYEVGPDYIRMKQDDWMEIQDPKPEKEETK